jgi:hypothetical protein
MTARADVRRRYQLVDPSRDDGEVVGQRIVGESMDLCRVLAGPREAVAVRLGPARRAAGGAWLAWTASRPGPFAAGVPSVRRAAPRLAIGVVRLCA